MADAGASLQASERRRPPKGSTMPITKTTAMTTGFLVALALPMTACAPKLPAVRPAAPAEAALTVFIDQDATFVTVVDDHGKDLAPYLRDALDMAVRDAGYKVVRDASVATDLRMHLGLAKVGFAMYGTEKAPWAEGVVLDVTTGGQPLARASRHTVNWSDYEGWTTKDRLTFAARKLVNEITASPELRGYTPTRPPAAASSPSSVLGSSTPASAPTPAAAMPTPGPGPTPPAP